jgi:hypothetical protein
MTTVQDLTSLTTPTRRGLRRGWYKNLQIIDSLGRTYRVIDAVAEGTNPLQWIHGIWGGRIQVKLEFDEFLEPEEIDLEEMKKLVRENLVKHRERFESGRSLAEFRSQIRDCQTHREVIECLPR